MNDLTLQSYKISVFFVSGQLFFSMYIHNELLIPLNVPLTAKK